MVKSMIKERRKFERAERVLSIEFRLKSAGRIRRDRSWRVSMTCDISRGGVSFYTDAQLRTDDVLEVKIIMSGMIEVYSGCGRVTRVQRRESAAYALVGVTFMPEKIKPSRLCHGGVC